MKRKIKRHVQARGRFRFTLSLLLAVCALSWLSLHLNDSLTQVQPLAAGPAQEFGYGFNVAVWDIGLVQSMGFNWIKVFSPPGNNLGVNVLMRVEADAGHLSDLSDFGSDLHRLAREQAGYIHAYEIGNEPNLDASYGWTVAPNAADYADLLCTAYDQIKAADPAAVVVSAGLAPTGRVTGNWEGHPGHNGFYQDEREFLKEFLAAGGGACLDVVGYHPYGFSADFDAEPDVPSGDSRRNCANGFCFRGVEKIYEIMEDQGVGQKKVWATEFNWIVEPPEHCLNDGSWAGRLWQIVTEARQAENLVGAFEYATTHYHWMDAMFVFNLNFNTAPWFSECEQMRYYGVEDRPAEAALRNMPKVPTAPFAQLVVQPPALGRVILPEEQPFSSTFWLTVSNSGTAVLTYTASVQTGGNLATTILSPTAVVDVGASVQVPVRIESDAQPAGSQGTVVVIDTTSPALDAPQQVNLSLHIFNQLHEAYGPVSHRP